MSPQNILSPSGIATTDALSTTTRPIGCRATFRIQVDLYPTISNLGNRVPFRIPVATTYNCLTTALGCHPLTLPLPSFAFFLPYFAAAAAAT